MKTQGVRLNNTSLLGWLQRIHRYTLVGIVFMGLEQRKVNASLKDIQAATEKVSCWIWLRIDERRLENDPQKNTKVVDRQYTNQTRWWGLTSLKGASAWWNAKRQVPKRRKNLISRSLSL